MKNKDLTKFTILKDYVIIKGIKKTENVNGLETPDDYDMKPDFGEVVALAKDAQEKLKLKDIVFFSRYGAEKVRVEGEDYLIIRLDDVIGVK